VAEDTKGNSAHARARARNRLLLICRQALRFSVLRKIEDSLGHSKARYSLEVAPFAKFQILTSHAHPV
jgi:hypothetical protein